jgi:hypothetical protein
MVVSSGSSDGWGDGKSGGGEDESGCVDHVKNSSDM